MTTINGNKTKKRADMDRTKSVNNFIYLDHAATTAVRAEVLDAMLPYFTEKFGNPSSLYTFAARNKEVVNIAREKIADVIGALPEEIYFTAGGSESDNWALVGTCEAYGYEQSSDHAAHSGGQGSDHAAQSSGHAAQSTRQGGSYAAQSSGQGSGHAAQSTRQGGSYATQDGGQGSDRTAQSSNRTNTHSRGHIITTKIEHHAVLHTCSYLEERGFDVTCLDVDESGKVDTEQLRREIRPDTILISVMFANNEIGTIEPIREIGMIARENGILFHTDAVQAFGQIPIDVGELGIDMLSGSGHKINGPKGTGFLYVRKGVKLKSFIHGGQQERGRRAGTENVPGIAGLGRAAELAGQTMNERIEKELWLRDYFIGRVLDEIPYTRLNGHETDRLPNNINISFQYVEGETILIMLDMAGICASSGSACTSGSRDPSHVLLGIGLPSEVAHGSVRFTLGYENTREELDFVVDKLKNIVTNLRSMSTAYQDFVKDKSRKNGM